MVVVTSTRHIYLGNKILLYSHFIGNSIEYGYKLKNPSFAPYYQHFESTSNDFNCRYPVRKSFIKGPKWLRELNYSFVYKLSRLVLRLKLNTSLLRVKDIGWEEYLDMNDESFQKLVKNTNRLCVQGWQYRDERNIVKHADQIKAYFTPKKHYRENVQKLQDKVRGDADVVVGVHIRQGDYKNFNDGKFYYTSEEYAGYMKAAISLFPDKKVSFIVCSNEQQSQSTFAGLKWTEGTGDFIEDMYTLAACDYIIGPPSTFSMWASFYGDTPLLSLENRDVRVQQNEFKIYLKDQ